MKAHASIEAGAGYLVIEHNCTIQYDKDEIHAITLIAIEHIPVLI